MEGVVDWVKNLVFYLLFLTLALSLLPAGKYEKYVRLFAGMVFVLAAVRPFTVSLRLEEKLAGYMEQVSFQNEAADFERELMGMEERRMEELTRKYEETVAEQVGEMAREAGVEPERVEVEIDGDRESERFGMVTEVAVVAAGKGKTETEPQRTSLEGSRISIEAVREVEPVDIGIEKEKGKAGQETAGGDGVQEGALSDLPEITESWRETAPAPTPDGGTASKSGSDDGERDGSKPENAPASSGNAAVTARQEPETALEGAETAPKQNLDSAGESKVSADLRRRIAEYYHLEEGHVEIQLEHE